MSNNSIVIIGAGQAGYQVAASLRQEGHIGSITLIGDEPGVPYQRPPLSKAYLLGKVAVEALRFRPPTYLMTTKSLAFKAVLPPSTERIKKFFSVMGNDYLMST